MFKTPHFTVRLPNPVFDFELRRLKRLASADRLRRNTLRTLIIPCVIVATGYMLCWLWLASTDSINASYGFGFPPSAIPFFICLMLLFAFVAVLILIGGFTYLGVSVHSINRQQQAGQWDFFRLMPLSPTLIYEAKLAAAELRAWRIMIIEISARLVCVVYLTLLSVLPPIAQSGEGRFLFDNYLRSFTQQPVSVLLETLIVIAIGTVFLLEPRWRMRALLSLGLYVSSRIRDIQQSSLAGFFALFAFHLLQAGWLFLTLPFVSYFSIVMERRMYSRDLPLTIDQYLIVYHSTRTIIIFAIIALLYAFYRVVSRIMERGVLHHAFRSEA